MLLGLVLDPTPALHGEQTSYWNGGSGSFLFPGNWTLGIPGSFFPATNEQYSFVQLPINGYDYTPPSAFVDSGTVSLLPSAAFIYHNAYPNNEKELAYMNHLDLFKFVIGSSATATVNSSNFNLGSDLYLGVEATGNGTLTADGAPPTTLTVPAGYSPLVVSHPYNIFSSILYAGKKGSGTVNVRNGAKLVHWDNRSDRTGNTYKILAGEQVGSHGTINVDGAGSRLEYDLTGFSTPNSTLGVQIGAFGTGALNITAGGSTLSRAGRLGAQTGSTGSATVSGANSRWDVDAQLWIGERGTGSLTVSDGGVVKTGFGDFGTGTLLDPDTSDVSSTTPRAWDFGAIGKFPGSDGSVLINGSNSRWENNANLIVGESGKGSLTLEGGTMVSSFRASGPTPDYADVPAATIGLNSGSTGAVLVKGAGGHWQNGSPLIVGAQGNGSLTVGSGGTVDVGSDPVRLGVTGAGTLIFGGDPAAGAGTLGGSIVEGGSGATTVEFNHNNAAGYTLGHTLKNIKTIKNTGTGTSILSGRIWDADAVLSTNGTLAISHSAVTNTTNFLVAQAAGAIEIDGATVKTPDVAVARTFLGVVGSGNLTVKGAGRLESSFAIGSGAAGNSGTLNVQGIGSTVLVQGLPLSVGYSRAGHLNISGGGKVINNDTAHNTIGALGVDPTGIGDAFLSGNFSRWDVGSLTVGNQGKGTVYVDTGATLSAGAMTLASAAGSIGNLYVRSGGTAQVNATTLVTGASGSGKIELTDGGVLKIGPTGQGDLILRDQSAGTGILNIGGGSLTPGVLSAKNVYSGSVSRNRATVLISHQKPDYVFTPKLFEVDLQVASGNIGTTTLTSPGNFLSYCSITSGGLRFTSGATATMDSELVVGDGGTIDLDNYATPYLELDGNGAYMDASNGIVVGKDGDGEVRLKNGGKLRVLDNTRQALNSLVLGDDSTGAYGRSCYVTFGGSATTAPGTLVADYIDGHATDARVIFNHSAPDFALSSYLTGTLGVRQMAGTTLLSGYLGYSGATTVSGGTLLVTRGASSNVSVLSGGTFGGKGTVDRVNAQSGSTVSPGTFLTGDGIASLRVTVLNFFGGSKVRTDLGPNLTSDKILNHKDTTVTTSLLPVTSGNITFEFHNKGMNQNGVYPIMTTTNVIPANFMDRLVYTSDFPLQGSFRQTRITNDPQSSTAYSQLEFVSISFTAPSEYQTWASSTYGLDSATTGAPSADPDHDGISNMLEYILGSSPVSGTSAALPVAVLSGNNLKVTFNRHLRLSGSFSTSVEYSPGMITWSTATPAMTSIGASDETFEPVTCTIPIPAGYTKMFARLKAVSLLSP